MGNPFATSRYELVVVLAPARWIAAGLVVATSAFTTAVVVLAALGWALAPALVLESITGLRPHFWC